MRMSWERHKYRSTYSLIHLCKILWIVVIITPFGTPLQSVWSHAVISFVLSCFVPCHKTLARCAHIHVYIYTYLHVNFTSYLWVITVIKRYWLYIVFCACCPWRRLLDTEVVRRHSRILFVVCNGSRLAINLGVRYITCK